MMDLELNEMQSPLQQKLMDDYGELTVAATAAVMNGPSSAVSSLHSTPRAADLHHYHHHRTAGTPRSSSSNNNTPRASAAATASGTSASEMVLTPHEHQRQQRLNKVLQEQENEFKLERLRISSS